MEGEEGVCKIVECFVVCWQVRRRARGELLVLVCCTLAGFGMGRVRNIGSTLLRLKVARRKMISTLFGLICSAGPYDVKEGALFSMTMDASSATDSIIVCAPRLAESKFYYTNGACYSLKDGRKIAYLSNKSK